VPVGAGDQFPGGAAAMLIGDERDRSDMAEYGEWNRKGAVLSDVTAQKEYGVTRDFIVKGGPSWRT